MLSKCDQLEIFKKLLVQRLCKNNQDSSVKLLIPSKRCSIVQKTLACARTDFGCDLLTLEDALRVTLELRPIHPRQMMFAHFGNFVSFCRDKGNNNQLTDLKEFEFSTYTDKFQRELGFYLLDLPYEKELLYDYIVAQKTNSPKPHSHYFAKCCRKITSAVQTP